MDALDTLARYVRDHSISVDTAAEGTVSVHFFHVLPTNGFDKDEFARLFNDWLANGPGAFDEAPVLKEIQGGPSYIRWGYWIGDQGLALTLMGLGQAAGLWTVATPSTLGIEGERADELAGLGMVMTTGLVGHTAEVSA